ncbi:PcfB family protein [Anaerotignum sp.]|uniref:PcfB family protein n=1 Tax=Anaerotignum sp. TaxID=2039241 RepID=UPI0028A8E1B4|nr:PcfB family protein [Anaerotignum sp.]
MQEDIDHRSITFAVNSTKMTARLLLKLIKMYLAHHKELPHGKQTVKQLAKHNQGMTNIEITDKNIKCFEKYAKKYGVDFALKKDRTETPPKYLVFFKAKDNDAIMSAFKEFSTDRMKKAEKPSVLQALREQKEKIKNAVVEKVKKKEQVR